MVSALLKGLCEMEFYFPSFHLLWSACESRYSATGLHTEHESEEASVMQLR